ncbi:MAG: phosphoribulokinase [Solirubrobacteraceae bacterium]|nr:phosphoribulokinase [Solirubrobacteraceae bacterium]
MARPIILGVVGDSATGKTTLSRGLVRMLGDNNVTHVAADDYHRYDRRQRAEHGITPLHPDCNYVDIMERHFAELRAGRAILKPVYQHKHGTFGPPVYTKPNQFTLIEGLLGYHTSVLRECYDVRVFLAPPEELRRAWKVQRDCSRRGYTTDQVLEELDRREPDSELYIRPQQRWADIVVSFMPGRDQDHLGAEIVLRKGLDHPDLSEFGNDGGKGLTLEENDTEHKLFVPGDIDPARGAQIEEAVWERMHFASHLRSERLGEFTVGTELHRSESLAVVQVLVLYHLATARAAVALGSEGTRADRDSRPAASSAT